MGLVKEIEEELKQKSNNVEAIEDILIRDSVLDHNETPKFDQFEEVAPGELRRKAEVELSSEYAGKPISRKRFSKSALKGDTDFQRRLKLLCDDDDEENNDSAEDLEQEIDESHENDRSDVDDEEQSESDAEQSESDAEQSESDAEQSESDAEQSESDAELEDGDEEEEGEEEEEEENDDDEEFDDELNLADFESKEPKEDKQSSGIDIFSAKAKDVDADISKGLAIKNQLSIWETLLELRIKLQPCIIDANKLFQKENFEKFKSELSSDDEAVVTKTYSALGDLMKSLLDLQERLCESSTDYRTENQERSKRKNDSAEESNDESIASSEASGNESLSETDDIRDDVRPQKKKRKPNQKNLVKDLYEEFKPFCDSSINKWYEKTRIASGKISSTDFSAFNLPPLKQIEQILYDKDRLIKKTQMLRSNYVILGKKEEVVEDVETQGKRKVQNEYDPEIFDDDDFYHKLLRDFIDRKAADAGDSSKHGRQWLKLQQMRSKMKRKVDMKASKGRRLRYTVHNKLVSFMAPIPNNNWRPEAEDKLFCSLFGKAVVRT